VLWAGFGRAIIVLPPAARKSMPECLADCFARLLVPCRDAEPSAER